eukprot:TRINITY_DN49225_c0_g1_i1.p1 TRINITY_DN49225_c0_g1~~TRINITY_DN49225_c0_g1_i1.p1  ORF type:complete len:318 (+),score=55.54 TRINITY_DN49225_c0_g1_i1:84-1037(+)
MEQDKQELLKEALNKTLSTKDIHNKLKTERDSLSANSEKKEQNKTFSSKDEKAYTSSVKNKSNVNESNIVKFLILIALLLLALVVFLFIKEDSLSKALDENTTNIQAETTPKVIEENKKLIEKEKENKEEISKDINKEELKTNAEEKVVEKKEKTSEKTNNDEPKVETKIITKEVIKEKVINLEKSDFKKYYNSEKFNIVKCYNFNAGSVIPPKQCKENIKKFIVDNKDALRFEVIPVIAEEDNIVFDKLKNNIKDLDKSFQEKVKEYMFRGFSRERVLETTWQIKELSPRGTIITPTNFYVKSKKNNKGVIIRAYY